MVIVRGEGSRLAAALDPETTANSATIGTVTATLPTWFAATLAAASGPSTPARVSNRMLTATLPTADGATSRRKLSEICAAIVRPNGTFSGTNPSSANEAPI